MMVMPPTQHVDCKHPSSTTKSFENVLVGRLRKPGTAIKQQQKYDMRHYRMNVHGKTITLQ